MQAVVAGDVFVCSWGYDQTNTDFYKVVAMTKSGKSVKIQKWNARVTGTDRVTVGDGPFTQSYYNHRTGEREHYVAPVETKRLRTDSSRPSISMTSYSSAYLVDPQAEHYATIHSPGH